MDTTTLWIIIAVAAVVVVALVVYRYGREIALNFKGWGVQAELQAKGDAQGARVPGGSRNVSIGRDATENQIVTGDRATAKKPTAAGAGRNVSIGGSAQDNVIVTGDGNKIGR
jgi:flagellar biosynthesis/type III secretory pathway M-ring protein FliF/YscJ